MHSTLELFSAKDIHSEGKVGFRFPTIPFLYHEYKIRNISIFYSLEFYFPKRAGEGRKSLHRPGLTSAYGLRRDISRVRANRESEIGNIFLFVSPYFMLKLGEKCLDRGKVV